MGYGPNHIDPHNAIRRIGTRFIRHPFRALFWCIHVKLAQWRHAQGHERCCVSMLIPFMLIFVTHA